jgi:hypothetical protein
MTAVPSIDRIVTQVGRGLRTLVFSGRSVVFSFLRLRPDVAEFESLICAALVDPTSDQAPLAFERVLRNDLDHADGRPVTWLEKGAGSPECRSQNVLRAKMTHFTIPVDLYISPLSPTSPNLSDK